MQQSFKDMAARHDNAVRDFIANVMKFANCTDAEARAVLGLYLDHKIARIDYGVGHVNVKHGAYLDPDVLQNAIDMTKQEA